MSATPPHADTTSLGYRFATAISYLINPLIIPPVQFGLVVWHFGGGVQEISTAAGIGLVFFFLIPLLYMAAMVRRGKAATLEIRRRDRRTGPFLFGIASYVVGLALLWMTLRTARPIVLTLAAVYPINTAFVALINLRWKISVHATSLAGFVAALLFIAWLPGHAQTLGILTLASVVPTLALVPLVMWARVRSGAHTFGQVLAGSFFGFGMTLVQLILATNAFGVL